MQRFLGLLGVYLLLATAAPARGAITLEGLTDRLAIFDVARFRAVPAEGFVQTAILDGASVAVEDWVQVTEVGYHLLSVARRELSTGATETALFQFVVLATNRGETEFGLPPWVPRPTIGSAAAEFDGAQMSLILPAEFPGDLACPVIAWVGDSDSRRWPVNGSVQLSARSAAPLILKRGIGFTFLPPTQSTGPQRVEGQIYGVQTNRSIHIESQTTWNVVEADLALDTLWPEKSRIHIRSNLTLHAGTTLTIDAGTVVKIAPGVEIGVQGTLLVRGTVERPVTFLPERREQPWGGFLLLQGPAKVQAKGAIFTGSGADLTYYNTHPIGGTHRREEALFHLGAGVEATFEDCWILELAGQAFHGGGGNLNLKRCLIQRCQTIGQFNGGSVQIEDSALLEFPKDDPQFVDGDNDAIYFTLGNHRIHNTLIGWTKDDCVDAGGDIWGDVEISRCWLESCFHEGMALSGSNKVVRVLDSVLMNCGQGVEAGYLSPQVSVSNCLITANLVGVRFGDNYAYTHTGFLSVTDSLLLHNKRDVWGFVRELWAEDLARMNVASNWITTTNPLYPSNSVWQAATDSPRLRSFRTAPHGSVGIGFYSPESRFPNQSGQVRLPVGLSCFLDREVTVDYELHQVSAIPGVDFQPAKGTLRFSPGQTVEFIPLDPLANPQRRFSVTLEVTLTHPSNAYWGSSPSSHRVHLLASGGQGDSDADGLPDDWETQIISAKLDDSIASIEAVDPDDDFDSDGMTNRAEYLAGTSPTDAQARLALRADMNTAGQVSLRFRAGPGRRYRVEATDALAEGAHWKVVAEFEPLTEEGDLLCSDPLPEGSNRTFYRVAVLGL